MNRKKLTLALIQLIAVVFLVTSVSFAWFAISNNTSGNLNMNVVNIDTDYEYFIYQDDTYTGSSSLNIQGNTCLTSSEQNCYLEDTDLQSISVIGSNHGLYPNSKLSFAIRITNSGEKAGNLSVSMSQLESIGYILEANKLQKAIEFTVTKVSYVNNAIEGVDVKDSSGIQYAGDGFVNNHFTGDDNRNYILVSGLPLNKDGNNSEVLVFFDLYFDPLVSCLDDLNQPTNNSNYFMGQNLYIRKLYIMLN